jgi:hypothetical protein
MSDNKNVCSSGWKGAKGSTITLENYNGTAVTVNDCKVPTCPFPFSSPAPGFSVPPKVGSTPGTRTATLKNETGTHCYCTVDCPGDNKDDTNPKTVIIS